VGGGYYRITAVHFSTTAMSVGLRFDTSSLGLLGEVLRAGEGSGVIRQVSVALRSPGGASGRPATEVVETFATAVVSSFDEHLSSKPTGTISLLLPAASRVESAPATVQGVTELADPSSQAATSAVKVYVRVAPTGGTHAVTFVELSQTAARAPVTFSFATSSRSLLDAIYHGQGSSAGLPFLRLAVRTGGGGRPFAIALTDTFSNVSVGSFAANLSGPFLGTATLVVGPH
jgi:hypothetical protein